MRRTISCAAFALLVLIGLALAACNTVEGAGEDIEAAGEAISEKAKEVKD